MEAKRRQERRLRRLAGAGVLALGLVATTALLSQYEPHLLYQDRGDRHEGLQPSPVGGFDVELISALMEYREDVQGWPERLRLRFYLADRVEVHVTVRELEYRWHYWLDKVRPAEPWKQGTYNEYSWPSQTVLRETSLEMYDLGAVVRLRKEGSSNEEWVAPALLYHSSIPGGREVDHYRFTLKVNGNAQVTCKFDRNGKEVHARPQNREIAGKPFTVRFPSAGQPEGWYRLVLSGSFESDPSGLTKTVHFYHRQLR